LKSSRRIFILKNHVGKKILIFGAIAKISNIYQFVDFLSKAQKKTLN
jgi:hypothetical protein